MRWFKCNFILTLHRLAEFDLVPWLGIVAASADARLLPCLREFSKVPLGLMIIKVE